MRVHVVHETTYSYELPARGLIQLLRLTPRDHDGQHILRWRIEPSSDGRLRPGEDSLGNLMHTYSCEGPLNELVHPRRSARSKPSRRMGSSSARWSGCPIFSTCANRASPQPTARSAPSRRTSSAIWRIDPLASLHQLLEALHSEVIFDTEPTHSATTAAEAFALRRGVCQDLSHIFIAACRGSRDPGPLRLRLFPPRRRRHRPGCRPCLGRGQGARSRLGRLRPVERHQRRARLTCGSPSGSIITARRRSAAAATAAARSGSKFSSRSRAHRNRRRTSNTALPCRPET